MGVLSDTNVRCDLCGDDEATHVCDLCNRNFCPECSPNRDDDAPFDWCIECAERGAVE